MNARTVYNMVAQSTNPDAQRADGAAGKEGGAALRDIYVAAAHAMKKGANATAVLAMQMKKSGMCDDDIALIFQAAGGPQARMR